MMTLRLSSRTALRLDHRRGTAAKLTFPTGRTSIASAVLSITHSRLSTGRSGCNMAMMSPQEPPYLNQCLLLQEPTNCRGKGRGRNNGRHRHYTPALADKQ